MKVYAGTDQVITDCEKTAIALVLSERERLQLIQNLSNMEESKSLNDSRVYMVFPDTWTKEQACDYFQKILKNI